MTRVCSFAPVISQKSKVLILGSMPGTKSLAANQYYAHPRNAFWPIMGELLGAGPEIPYEKRLTVLKNAGLALWDVLEACVRPGSLDSAITDEVANDFGALFKRHPHITHVFFNGAKAEQAFKRHVVLEDGRHIFTRLPSTSPAHASLNLKAKIKAWRAVEKALR